MREMIGFELSKILRKPIAWAALGIMLSMTLLMVYNWVFPGYVVVREEINHQWVEREGIEGIARNKEIAGQYKGSLTVEKVREIIETFLFSKEMMMRQGMDPEAQGSYDHNSLYDMLDDFRKVDGSYNGVLPEEVYGDQAESLHLGYFDNYEKTIYVLLNLFILWGYVIIVVLVPVFSQEYAIGMDALILTGSQGRKRCPRAKVAAAYLVALAGSLILLGSVFLVMLLSHGMEGFDTSVQLGELKMFSHVPYPMTWGQMFGFGCLLWVGGVVILTAMILVVSSLVKNSFSGLVTVLVLYTAPLFVPWQRFPTALHLAGMMMPINQFKAYVFEGFAKFDIGGSQLNVMWLTLPVAILIGVAGIFWSGKAFARHQVR